MNDPRPMPDEPQTLTVTLVFKTKHNPGNELHLTQLAQSYFIPKGIKMSDDRVIEL